MWKVFQTPSALPFYATQIKEYFNFIIKITQPSNLLFHKKIYQNWQLTHIQCNGRNNMNCGVILSNVANCFLSPLSWYASQILILFIIAKFTKTKKFNITMNQSLFCIFDSQILISLPFLSVSKKDIIAKQIVRHFVQYIECPSNSPFYATQIINLFFKFKDLSQSR